MGKNSGKKRQEKRLTS